MTSWNGGYEVPAPVLSHIENLQQEVDVLKREKKQKNEQFDGLEMAKKKLDSDMRKISDEYKQLQAECAKISDRKIELERLSQEQSQDIKRQQERISMVETQLERCRADKLHVESECQKLRQDNVEMRLQLQQLNDQTFQFDKENRRLKDTVTSMKNSLDSKDRESRDFERTIARLEADLENQRTRWVNREEEDKQNQKKENTQLNNAISSLSTKHREEKEEFSRRELDWQRQTAEMQEIIDKLTKKVESVTQRYEHSRAQCERLLDSASESSMSNEGEEEKEMEKTEKDAESNSQDTSQSPQDQQTQEQQQTHDFDQLLEKLGSTEKLLEETRSKNEVADQLISKYRSDIDELNGNLVEKERVVTELISQCNDLAERYEKLQQESRNMQGNASHARDLKSKLQRERTDWERKINDIKDACEEEIIKMDGHLKTKDQLIQSLQLEKQQLQQVSTRLHETEKRLSKENSDIIAQLHDLGHRHDDLTQQLSTIRTRLANEQTVVDNLKHALTTKDSELSHTRSELERTKKQYKEELEGMRQSLTDLQLDVKVKETEIRNIHSANNKKFEERLQERNKKVSQLEKTISQLRAQVDDATDKLRSSDTRITSLTEERRQIAQRLEKMKSEYEVERESKTKELCQLKENIAKLEITAHEKQKLQSELRTALDTARQQVLSKTTLAEQLEAEIVEIKEENVSRAERILELLQEMEKRDLLVDEQKKQIERLEETLEIAKSDVRNERSRTEELSRKNGEIMDNVQKLTAQLHATNEAKEELKNSSILLEEKIGLLSRQLEDISLEREQLDEKAKSLVSHVDQVVAEKQSVEERFEEESRKMQSAIDLLEQQNKEMEKHVGDMQQDIDSKRADLADCRSTIEQNEQDKFNLQQQVDRLRTSHATEISKFEQETIAHQEKIQELEVQIRDKQKIIDNTVAELEETKQQMVMEQRSHSESESRCNELQSQTLELQESVSSLTKVNAQHELTVHGLQQENELLTLRNGEWQTDNAKLKADIEELTTSLSRDRATLETLQGEAEQLHRDNKELQNDITNVRNVLASVEERSASLEETRDSLQRLADENKISMEQLREQLHDTEQSNEQQVVKFETTIENLQREIDTRGVRIEDLETEMQTATQSLERQLEHANQTISIQAEEAEEKLKDVQLQLSDAMGQNRTLNETMSNLTSELDSTTRELHLLQSTSEETMDKLDRIQQDADQLLQQLEQEQDKVISLETKLSKVTQDSTTVTETLQTELTRERTAIDELKLVHEDAFRQNQQLQSEISSLQAQLEHLASENRSQENDINAMRGDKNEMESELRIRSNTIEQLQTELGVATESLSASKELCRELENRVDELQQSLQLSSTINDSLERRLQEENDKLKSLDYELEEVSSVKSSIEHEMEKNRQVWQQERDHLEQRLAELNSEISDLVESKEESVKRLQGELDITRQQLSKDSHDQLQLMNGKMRELEQSYETKLRMQEEDVEQLQSEKTSLLASISTLQSEHEVLMDQHDQLEKHAKSTEEALQNNINELSQQKSELESQVEATNDRISILEKELDNIQNTLTTESFNRENAEQLCKEREEEISLLRASYDTNNQEMSEKIDELNKVIANLRTELDNKLDHISQLQTNRDELVLQVQTLEVELQGLRHAIEQEKKDLESRVSKLLCELEQEQQSTADRKQQNAILEEENKNVSAHNEELRSQLENLQSKLDNDLAAMERTLVEKEQHMEATQERISDLEETLEKERLESNAERITQQTKIDDLQQELMSAQSSGSELMAKCSSLTVQVEDLNKQLNFNRDHAANIDREAQELQQVQKQEYESQLAVTRDELVTLKETIASVEKSLSESNETRKQLEEQQEEYQRRIDLLMSEKKMMESQRVEMDTLLSASNAQVAHLEEQLAQQIHLCEDLSSKMELLQRENDNQLRRVSTENDGRIVHIQQQLDERDAKVASLDNTIRASEERVEQLQLQLDTSNRERKRIASELQNTEEQLESLRKKNSEMEDKNQSYDDLRKQIILEVTERQEQLHCALEEEKDDSIRRLQEEIAETKRKLEEKSALADMVVPLRQHVSQLEEEKRVVLEDLEKLELKIKQLEQQILGHDEQIAKMSVEHETIVCERQKLLDSVQRDLEHAVLQQQEMNNSINEKDRNITEFRELLVERDNSIEILDKQLEASQSHIERLQTQIDSEKSEAEHRMSQLLSQSTEKELEALSTRHSEEMAAMNDEHKRTFKEQQDIVDTLRQELRSSKRKQHELHLHCDESKRAQLELETRSHEFEARHSALLDEIEALRKQLEDNSRHADVLEHTRIEQEQMQQALDDAKLRHGLFAQRVAALESYIIKVEQTVVDISDEVLQEGTSAYVDKLLMRREKHIIQSRENREKLEAELLSKELRIEELQQEMKKMKMMLDSVQSDTESRERIEDLEKELSELEEWRDASVLETDLLRAKIEELERDKRLLKENNENLKQEQTATVPQELPSNSVKHRRSTTKTRRTRPINASLASNPSLAQATFADDFMSTIILDDSDDDRVGQKRKQGPLSTPRSSKKTKDATTPSRRLDLGELVRKILTPRRQQTPVVDGHSSSKKTRRRFFGKSTTQKILDMIDDDDSGDSTNHANQKENEQLFEKDFEPRRLILGSPAKQPLSPVDNVSAAGNSTTVASLHQFTLDFDDDDNRFSGHASNQPAKKLAGRRDKRAANVQPLRRNPSRKARRELHQNVSE